MDISALIGIFLPVSGIRYQRLKYRNYFFCICDAGCTIEQRIYSDAPVSGTRDGTGIGRAGAVVHCNSTAVHEQVYTDLFSGGTEVALAFFGVSGDRIIDFASLYIGGNLLCQDHDS